MRKEDAFQFVRDLPFDEKKTFFQGSDLSIQLFRPSVLSKRFSHYDKNKNFQIWLTDGERDFRPNHLRILIDLNLRVRCRKDLMRPLMLAFDNIYYGADPEKELDSLAKEAFEHYLNSLQISGVLSQLFHIEQEYGYTGTSRFVPPNLFLQGWIREFLDNPKEIDNLCMSVCNRQPPKAQYVNLENQKHKKYQSNLPPLWYLDRN